MAAACAKRECCASQIRQKLNRYALDDSAKEKIIKRLKNDKFLDESRYCRSFINDKLRFNKWGRVKIEFALRQKNIPQETIAEAFGEFPDSSFNEKLQPLLEHKLKSVKGATDYEKRTKLIRFALGRGFAMDETLKCVDNIFTKNPKK